MSTTPAGVLATIDLTVLGQRLREARTRRGLTQRQIAGRDVSVAYVSRIEAGQRRPDMQLLARICKRLDVTVDELLAGMNDQQAEELVLSLEYAELALMSGDAPAAELQLRDVMQRAPEGSASRRHATWLLARALEAQGQLNEAVDLLESLVSGPPALTSIAAAIALCRCYREAGDLSRAIHVGEAALAAVADGVPAGDDEEVQLVVTLAAAYFERGDTVYATRLCSDALRRADARGSRNARAAAYWNASVMHHRRGSTAEAVRLASRALALLAEGDDSRNIARLRAQLGRMMLQQSPPDVPGATSCLEQARAELVATDGSDVDIARCDGQLARARLATGDLEGASSLASSVRSLADTWPMVAADADATLGRVAAMRGDLDEARQMFRRAIGALSGAEADRDAAQLWYELGGLLDAAGDGLSARDAYRSAAACLGLVQPDVELSPINADLRR